MNYYIFVNNEQQGPYTLEELRARHIASDTLVWREWHNGLPPGKLTN